MPSHTPLPKFLGLATLTLGGLSLLIVSASFLYREPTTSLAGRLLPAAMRKEVPWRVYSPDMIMSGATIPSDTNVIIELPFTTGPIARRVLFGTRDPDVRYWGYCLPENYDQTKAMQFDSLPGRVFLSEGERKAREDAYKQKLSDHFSVPENLTEEDLNQLRKQPAGKIRHAVEIFDPGSICYVMSQVSLAVGIDRDDDEANEQVEHEYGTDFLVPDTDGDGLSDGREIFYLHTSSLRRDTDGDGLIDGLEDANQNGYLESTETNPLKWDTDRDGLPDGLMKLGTGHNTRILGEDKNLNGTVDEDESDPRKWSTLQNGISDGERYYQCLLGGGENC